MGHQELRGRESNGDHSALTVVTSGSKMRYIIRARCTWCTGCTCIGAAELKDTGSHCKGCPPHLETIQDVRMSGWQDDTSGPSFFQLFSAFLGRGLDFDVWCALELDRRGSQSDLACLLDGCFVWTIHRARKPQWLRSNTVPTLLGPWEIEQIFVNFLK